MLWWQIWPDTLKYFHKMKAKRMKINPILLLDLQLVRKLEKETEERGEECKQIHLEHSD